MTAINPSARIPSFRPFRRQYLRSWGRLLAELRRLSADAHEATSDLEVLSALDRLTIDAEVIAVCMAAPGQYQIAPRPHH